MGTGYHFRMQQRKTAAFGLYLVVTEENFTRSSKLLMEYQATSLMAQSTLRSNNRFQSKCKEVTFSSFMEESSTKAMITPPRHPDTPIHGTPWKNYQNGLKKTGSVLNKLTSTKLIKFDLNYLFHFIYENQLFYNL